MRKKRDLTELGPDQKLERKRRGKKEFLHRGVTYLRPQQMVPSENSPWLEQKRQPGILLPLSQSVPPAEALPTPLQSSCCFFPPAMPPTHSPSPYLGGSELVPQEDISDEDDDGDDNRQGSPQVHTGCVQVFDDPESPQLLSPPGLYSGLQHLFPPEELDDPHATQQLCHELRTEQESSVRWRHCSCVSSASSSPGS